MSFFIIDVLVVVLLVTTVVVVVDMGMGVGVGPCNLSITAEVVDVGGCKTIHLITWSIIIFDVDIP